MQYLHITQEDFNIYSYKGIKFEVDNFKAHCSDKMKKFILITSTGNKGSPKKKFL